MNLADWRRRIDEIDKKLVELLNERSRCALEIGKLKQAENIPLYQPERENEVLENAEHNNSGPLTDAAIRRLFERIIDANASLTKRAPPNAMPCIPATVTKKAGMNDLLWQSAWKSIPSAGLSADSFRFSL